MYNEDRETVLNLMPLVGVEGGLLGVVVGIVVREERAKGGTFLMVEACRSLNRVVLWMLLGRSWRGRGLRMCNRYISNFGLVGMILVLLALNFFDRVI